MRLDQYLKKSCLLKQRSGAKELCDAGRVRVNKLAAKASRDLAVGDVLTLELMHKRLTVKILALPAANLSKAKARETYQILSEEPIESYPRVKDIWER